MREARVSIVNTRTTGVQDPEKIMAAARERIDIVGQDHPDIILMTEVFAKVEKERTQELMLDVCETVPGPLTRSEIRCEFAWGEPEGI
jgi:hypothetical protein